jgi:DNA excision repair protein ERCC-2
MQLTLGLKDKRDAQATDTYLANPVLPKEILEGASPSTLAFDAHVPEAIPGTIRKAEHFLSFLNRFVDFIKALLFLFS